MRKLILICIGFLPVLCIAQPAANETVGNAPMESNPGSESLTDEQIASYQLSAIKKVQDFYDYLGVISNSTYEKQMREDAKRQARQLFYGTDCSVEGKIAMRLIDSCFNAKDKITWKAVNIKVKEKMTAKADVLDSDYYEGVLTFTVSGSTDTKERKAYIVLVKSKKQFGVSNKEGWTALICDIR